MRVQLALNVKDLDEAVEFYSKLFDAKVNKRKPGYANFAIDEPPLKLVLFENPDAEERLNHRSPQVRRARRVGRGRADLLLRDPEQGLGAGSAGHALGVVPGDRGLGELRREPRRTAVVDGTRNAQPRAQPRRSA